VARDHRLGFVDLATAGNGLAAAVDLADHVIAVAETAAGAALLDPAAQAAPGLGCQVLEKQGAPLRIPPSNAVSQASTSLQVTEKRPKLSFWA
jgi:hypothetical protein